MFSEADISSQPQSPTPLAASGWIAIAHLLRPQGRRGELLCDLLTDLEPAVQFAADRLVTLVPSGSLPPGPSARSTTIEGHFMPTGKNAGRIVLKFAAANSISEAETLAGLDLVIPADQLPTLDDDTFYVADLVGSTLLDGETAVGEVVDVEFATSPDGRVRLADAAPLLAVHLLSTPPEAEPVLIPFVRAWLVSVDVSTRRITMNLPEGLAAPTPS
ncbi:MAG: 16S rRNA processing protein RimM [Bryocella sp.]